MRLMRLMAALSLAVPILGSADFSNLYDAGTLRYWQARYQTSTTKILDQVIRPALYPQEARRLAGVPLDFPLLPDADMRGNPLAFYVPPDFSRVVLPVSSLKFLDDLCTAYAWLQINGYVIDTVSEYAAMLKYKNFRGAPYPRPLAALHIPANALDDKRVDELALGHFVTARTFLLLHELGHVYHRPPVQSLENEKAADAFAAQVMPRTGLPPLGALVFFMADASWAGYPPEPGTHPLSGSRLLALASRMEDRELADGIARIGADLDDRELRASIALTGRSTDETTLMPRRGHLQMRVPLAATQAATTLAFDGRFAGMASQDADPGSQFAIELILRRSGNRVTGQYSFGLGLGIIDGTVEGSTLQLHWRWGGREGVGILRATADGRSFTGTWGYGTEIRGGGTWAARRQ
jgi:hypothetical protein